MKGPGLSGRIFLLAFVNVVLLALVFLVFARVQFHLNLDTLFFAPAEERVVDLAQQVALDLQDTPVGMRNDLMGRLAKTYKAEFYLFSMPELKQVAGPAVTLPQAVRDDLARPPAREAEADKKAAGSAAAEEQKDGAGEKAGPPPERKGSPPPQEGPPPREGPPREGAPPREGPPRGEKKGPPLTGRLPGFGEGPPFEGKGPDAGKGGGAPPEQQGQAGGAAGFEPNRPPEPAGFERPRLLQLESGNPALYWVGVRIPLHSKGSGTTVPGVLFIASHSFVGTPLFFDYKPWLPLALAVLAVFALCWLPFIRGLTRAVKEMSHVTERIAEGEFHHQLPEARGDEVGHLAAAINRMGARIAGFAAAQKRFLGDIAHELSAPIARLQFALGILERNIAEEKAGPGAVDDLHEEVRAMSTLVSELLNFSKIGMQQARPLVAVDVAEVAKRAVAREAGGRGVEIDVEAGLRARADEESLLRALSNLLRNALRYAGEAGPIRVRARRERDEVVIAVEDSGPGLPEAEVERVFEPFYRVETSRNRESGGVGLGLAIVRAAVEACGGRVKCRNRVPAGLEVEMRLAAG